MVTGKVMCNNNFAILLAAIATLGILTAFSVLLVQLELESNDDLALLHRASSQSLGEIFSTEYLTEQSSYYRPLVTLISKLVYHTAGTFSPIFRIVQVIFIITLLVQFHILSSRLEIDPIPQAVGILYIFSSQFTFTFLYWWSDLASLISANCFLATILFIHDPPKRVVTSALSLTSISVVSVLSKELGVINVLLFTMFFLLNKRYVVAMMAAAVGASYLWIRTLVCGSFLVKQSFHAASGFLGQAYSIEQLSQKFGEFPYIFYLYNIVAQFMSLATSQPINGQFIFPAPKFILVLTWFSMSTVVLVGYVASLRKLEAIHKYLFLAIAVNIVMSYAYCRSRNLAIAGVAYSILLALATQHLGRVGGSPAFRKCVRIIPVILFAGYLGYASLMVIHLDKMRLDEVASYARPHPKGDLVDQKIYDLFRQKYIKTGSRMGEGLSAE